MAEDLSVEAAASLLSAPETQEEQTQQPDEIEASSTEAEDASEEETPGDDVEVETDTEAEAEPVEAPTWWAPEAKDKFAQLPPDLQAVVLEQEGTRERVTSKAKEEAATAKKAADLKVKELTDVVQRAAEVLPRAEQSFQSRWENVDWVAYAEMVVRGEASASDYSLHKAQYDAELTTLETAKATASKAAAEAAKVADEQFETEIATLAPALCEPSKGPANRQALADYLVKNGVPREVIPHLKAAPVALYWKALQFDKAQAALKSRPKAIPQKANVTPTPTPQRTSQQRSVEQIAGRLDRSGDVDDAVALMQARRRA